MALSSAPSSIDTAHAARTAFAMNNMALTLFERGHFVEAKQNFGHALHILASITNNTSKLQLLKRQDLDNALRQTDKLVSQTEPTLSRPRVAIYALDDEEHFGLLTADLTSSTPFMLRIGTVAVDSVAFEMESCAVLINYGVTRRQLAFAAKDHKDMRFKLNIAKKTFHLAYCTLSKHHKDTFQPDNSVFLAAMSLKGLVLTGLDVGSVQELREYQRRLKETCRAITVCRELGLLQACNVAPVA